MEPRVTFGIRFNPRDNMGGAEYLPVMPGPGLPAGCLLWVSEEGDFASRIAARARMPVSRLLEDNRALFLKDPAALLPKGTRVVVCSQGITRALDRVFEGTPTLGKPPGGAGGAAPAPVVGALPPRPGAKPAPTAPAAQAVAPKTPPPVAPTPPAAAPTASGAKPAAAKPLAAGPQGLPDISLPGPSAKAAGRSGVRHDVCKGANRTVMSHGDKPCPTTACASAALWPPPRHPRRARRAAVRHVLRAVGLAGGHRPLPLVRHHLPRRGVRRRRRRADHADRAAAGDAGGRPEHRLGVGQAAAAELHVRRRRGGGLGPGSVRTRACGMGAPGPSGRRPTRHHPLPRPRRDLSQNRLWGALPAAWASIPGLKVVDLHSNTLATTLPPAWGGMASLEML
jgi:hypothetical protein